MKLPKNLLAIGRAGAGVNNIPVDKCSEKGIVVFNTPGANANAVKELVLAGLLLSSRDLYQGMAYVQTLKGKADEVPGHRPSRSDVPRSFRQPPHSRYGCLRP